MPCRREAIRGGIDDERWRRRIAGVLRRWWGTIQHRPIDPSIREDVSQACWVAIYAGTIRESSWGRDLHAVMRDTLSLHVRGVRRGSRTVPWLVSGLPSAVRRPALPLDTQTHLRQAIRRVWAELDARERLIVYGLCCVPGPTGQGGVGVPHAWAAQWGLTRMMIETRRQHIRRRLRQALDG